MFALLFYIVIGWILVSLGVGVHASVVKGKSTDLAISAAAHTLLLPYHVVKKLFGK